MARGIGIFFIIIGTFLYLLFYSDKDDIQYKIFVFYTGLVFILIGVILYNFKNIFGKKIDKQTMKDYKTSTTSTTTGNSNIKKKYSIKLIVTIIISIIASITTGFYFKKYIYSPYKISKLNGKWQYDYIRDNVFLEENLFSLEYFNFNWIAFFTSFVLYFLAIGILLKYKKNIINFFYFLFC